MTKTKYTLVRHTGYTQSGNPQFSRAVELRGVTDAKADKIEKAGGVVFGTYGAASDAEEAANYPPGVGGLIPRVRGAFVRVEGFGEQAYRPADGEVLT